MSMVVQHNMSAMNANRNLGVISGQLSKSTEKLSSGYRINRAGDDAAGLAISEKMRGQINGLNRASTNAQDGISLIQTAEGALTETHSILQRMRELSVQAASDTNTDDDRTQIQNEIEQLTNEIDRIATTTEFNTMKLLDGSRSGAVTAKEGSAYVEGTFTNSMVTAEITTDNSAAAEYTEIARVEITKDFVAGMSTKGTAKYTQAELDAAYTAVTSSTPDVSTASAEKAIAAALKDAKTNTTTGLKKLTDTYDTSSDAVKSNQTVISEFLNNSKAIEELLVDGKTVKDVEDAAAKLYNAYVSAGQTTTDNEEIKAASAELKALFDTTSTAKVENTTAAETITYTKADGTSDSTIATAGTTAATTVVGTAATNFYDQLAAGIKALGGVAAQNQTDKAAVDKQQKTVDLLSNTDLMKAKIEYELAKTDRGTTNATPTTAEEIEAQARMDAAQAKMDSLNKEESVLTITDLFGNATDSTKFEISDKVADDGTLTITLKNNSAGAEDTIITISNANQLKAGDVITITSNAKVESHAANAGEEALRLQIGANAGQEMNMSINSMRAKDLGIVQTKEGSEGKALDVTSQASASLAVNAFDLAIQKVSTERAKMGAVQNRLEHTIANLDTSAENLQAAESRIRDTDMAEEMTTYSKNNILQQAGQSMLAQANQSNQGVLSLLQ